MKKARGGVSYFLYSIKVMSIFILIFFVHSIMRLIIISNATSAFRQFDK